MRDVTNAKRAVADDVTFWILAALGHNANTESCSRHYLRQLGAMEPGKTQQHHIGQQLLLPCLAEYECPQEIQNGHTHINTPYFTLHMLYLKYFLTVVIL